eukprot:UN14428
MKIFSRTQNTTKRKKTKQTIYVRMQVLHELMSLLNYCKAKKEKTLRRRNSFLKFQKGNAIR